MQINTLNPYLPLDFSVADSSWHAYLRTGLAAMDQHYLKQLTHSSSWLPGSRKIFNAFSLPLDRVQYVLFGESPYPRRESANGYAFWDHAVNALWSSSGLSKQVNRATSLRNIIKMLLIAEGLLDCSHPTQENIARIDKSNLVQTSQALFSNFLHHGFLLLNATLVLQSHRPQKDVKAWCPFLQYLLDCILTNRPHITLILLGRLANTIDQLIPTSQVKRLYAMHPYNLAFISHPQLLSFFKPLHLLRKLQKS